MRHRIRTDGLYLTFVTLSPRVGCAAPVLVASKYWFRWQESNLQACATSDLQSDTIPIRCHRNKLVEVGGIEPPFCNFQLVVLVTGYPVTPSEIAVAATCTGHVLP